MKRFILFLAILCSVCICNAQRYQGITKTLSIRVLQGYKWSAWSTEFTKVKVVIDSSRSKIIIHSNIPQIYNIISAEYHYYDSVSECWEFKVIDQDGDTGTLVARYGVNWVQIHIKFADIQWVYHIE